MTTSVYLCLSKILKYNKNHPISTLYFKDRNRMILILCYLNDIAWEMGRGRSASKTLGGGRNGTRKRQRSKHKQKNDCKKVDKTPNKLMISAKKEKIVR